MFGTHYVTKEFTFDAAHQLPNHTGLCKNIHGHTYKLQVTLTGLVLEVDGSSQEGMVVDFKDMKDWIKDMVLDKFDHAFIAKGDEPILPTLKELGSKVFEIGVRTTAENMARYIFETLCLNLPPNVFVKNVRLYETPTSYADYKAKDYEQQIKENK